MTTPSPAPRPPLTEPTAFRRLIDEAATLSRQHFRALFVPIALPIVAIQVLYATVQVASMRQMGDFMTAMIEGDFSELLPVFGISFLAAIVMGALFALAITAALSGTANAVAGRPVNFASHWGHALKPRVLGTTLVLGFLVGLGYTCCILPGLFLATLWGFAISASVEDDLHGLAAMERSYQLTGHNPQGKWTTSPRFKIFILLFVGWLLSTAISLMVQMPLQIVQQIMATRQAVGSPEEVFASDWWWLMVPNAALGALGSSLVLLYLGFGIALLYWDVRRRREGSDLETELQALDVPRHSLAVPPLPPVPPPPTQPDEPDEPDEPNEPNEPNEPVP